MNIQLRNYQKDCIKAIEDAGDGSHLIVMATGLGYSMFSHTVFELEEVHSN